MRLTYRLSNGECIPNPENDLIIDKETGYRICINKLAEYEDLEEQGQLVKLPCKVGDTLYWIDGDNDNEIVELTVIEFRYDLNDRLICRAKYADKTDYVDLFDFEFGKTVFLSREEAEAALKGITGC